MYLSITNLLFYSCLKHINFQPFSYYVLESKNIQTGGDLSEL